MKIQRLIIHNIASIEDADINFSEGLLAHEPLFLICGETGAGKTTILDAICLALYNNTPRMNRSHKENIGEDENNKLYINDNRLLMRRGAGEASSTLYFEGNNHVNYEAKWYVKRAWMKGDGKLKTVEWSLTKLGKNISLTKHAEINHELELAVGLNFEQFCRTTMLAQGEFTKFLQSDAKSKSEILEKLTGTDIYSRIGSKIAEITKAKKYIFELQKKKTDSYTFLSAEQKTAMQERQQALHTEREKLAVQNEKLQACINWLNTANELTKKIAEKKESLQNHLQKKESDLYKKQLYVVQLYDTASEILPEVKILQEKEAVLSDLEKEVEQYATRYQQLFAELQGEISQIDKMKLDKERIVMLLSENEVYQPMFEQMQTVISQLQELLKEHTLMNKLRNDLTSKNAETDKGKRLIISNETQLKKHTEALQSLMSKSEEIEQKLSLLKDAQPLAKQEKIFQSIESLKTIQTTISTYLEQLQEEKIKTEELEKCSKEVDTLKKEYEATQEKLNHAKEQWEKTELLYSKQKMSIENWAKEARAKLMPGDVCPVCRREITETLHEEELITLLSPLSQQLEKDKQNYQSLEFHFNKVHATLQATSDKENSLQEELKKAKSKSLLLREKATQLTSDIPLNVQGLDTIEQQLEGLKKQLKVLKEQINEIDLLDKQYSELKTQERKIRAEKEKIAEILKGIQNQLSEQEGIIKTIKEQQSHTEKVITQRTHELQNMILLSNWESEWNSSPQKFMDKLQQMTAQWQTWNKEKERLEQQIKEGEDETKRIKDLKEKLLQEHPSFGEIQIKSATPQPNLEIRCNNFLQTVISTQTEMRGVKKEMEQKKVFIEQFITTHTEYTLGILIKLNSVGTQKINNIKQLIHQTDENILKAETELNTIENELKEHNSHQPENVSEKSLEDCKNEVASLKETDNRLSDEISNLKMSIKNDEEQKDKLQEDLEILKKAEAIYLEWDRLKQLFGDDLGVKFRGIAQSFVLKELLNGANYYLKYFTDRYELTGQPGGLAILLKDFCQGGVIRPVTTLSGGESFLVSLSLALGLSALNRNGQDIDTLFIDEGFGTLSSDYLNTVMDTLEKLHQIGGKRVGIISHVEELKERIKTQIQVKKEHQSKSVVQTVRL